MAVTFAVDDVRREGERYGTMSLADSLSARADDLFRPATSRCPRGQTGRSRGTRYAGRPFDVRSRRCRVASTTDLGRLQQLASERDAARAEIDAHLRRCVASPPHGYAVCQMRYERLAEALERAERRLRTVTDLARMSTE